MKTSLKRRRVDFDNPDEQLGYRRARNDQRLKSRFESIFEKYGKDFSDVADEIDLEKGEIVVDNGHIRSMRDEQDTGDRGYELGKLREKELADGDDTTQSRPPQGKDHVTELASDKGFDNGRLEVDDIDSLLGDMQELEGPVRNIGPLKASSNNPILRPCGVSHSSGSRPQHQVSPYRGRQHEPEELAIDPKWRAPVIPNLGPRPRRESSFDGQSDSVETESQRSQSPLGKSLWAPSGPSPAASVLARNRRVSPSIYFNGGKRWTMEEEKLLTHLKSNTTLNYHEMQVHFCDRHSNAIKVHWKKMKTAKNNVRERRKPGTTAHWTKAEEDLLYHMKTSSTLSPEEMMEKLPGRTKTGIKIHWLKISKIRTKTDVSIPEEMRSTMAVGRPSLLGEDFEDSSQSNSQVEQLRNESDLQLHPLTKTKTPERDGGSTAVVIDRTFKKNPTDSLLYPLENSVASTSKDPKVLRVVVKKPSQTPEISTLIRSVEDTYPPLQLHSPAESAKDLNPTQLPSRRLSSGHPPSEFRVASLVSPDRPQMTRVGVFDKSRPSGCMQKVYTLTPTSSANVYLRSQMSPDILNSPSLNSSTRPLPGAETSSSKTKLHTLNRGKILKTLNSRNSSSSLDMPRQTPGNLKSSKLALTVSSPTANNSIKQANSLPLSKDRPQVLASTISGSTPNRQGIRKNKAHPSPISRTIPRTEGPESRVKLLSKVRRAKSASFASAIFASSHGELSDDELSLPLSTVSIVARGKLQRVKKTGTSSRQCGSAGFKCKRSLCLRCT